MRRETSSDHVHGIAWDLMGTHILGRDYGHAAGERSRGLWRDKAWQGYVRVSEADGTASEKRAR